MRKARQRTTQCYSLLRARLELEKRLRVWRGLVSAQPRSLTLLGICIYSEENVDAAEEEAEGLRGVVRQLETRIPGQRVESFPISFACQRCTLFSLKNPLSRTRVEGNAWAVRFEHCLFFLVFHFFLDPSCLLLFYAGCSPFLQRRSPRPHEPLSMETEVAKRIFTARDRVAPRSFPTDYATHELSCSLNISTWITVETVSSNSENENRRHHKQKLVKVRRSSLILSCFYLPLQRTMKRLYNAALFSLLCLWDVFLWKRTESCDICKVPFYILWI